MTNAQHQPSEATPSPGTKPEDTTLVPRPFLTAGFAIVVAAAACAFALPTRNGAFLSGDDHRYVLEQVFVNHPSLAHAARLLTIVHGDLYQPIPMLSFQANYAMAGPDPSGQFPVSPYIFHITNIALHMLNACLAFLVAVQLARGRKIGLLAGLMFACHPFAMETVAWINGRMILLATTFGLLAFWFCLSQRPRAKGLWAWLGGLAWLMSLLSKVLPSVPVAIAIGDYHKNGPLSRKAIATYAVLLLLAGAATWFATKTSDMSGLMELTETESTTSAPVRLLLATRYYVENYVRPTRLSAWSPPAKAVSLVSADVGIALLECVGLGILAILAWRRNRLAFVGLCIFVLLLAPFLAATTARRMLTADRYMYFPIFGLHLAVAAVCFQGAKAIKRRWSTAPAAIVSVPAVAALLVAWLLVGHRIAPAWGTTLKRAQRGVEVYPDESDIRVELARAYVWSKDAGGALTAIEEARKRWPNNPRLAAQAGEAYRLLGDWPAAEKELRFAAERMPQHVRTLYYHAITLEQLGRTADARAELHKILDLSPGFVPAATTLARGYESAGDDDAAADMYEQALKANPYHRDALFELAILKIRHQQYEEAETLLRRITESDPHDRPAMMNLAVVFVSLGKPAEALAINDRLLQIEPGAVSVQMNRAGLLVSMGQYTQAEEAYRAILNRQPDHHNAQIGLHELLQQQARYNELVVLWKTRATPQADPDAEARAWLIWSLVLAQRTLETNEVLATLSPHSAQWSFAQLALAFAALQSENDDALRSCLAYVDLHGPITPTRREQARSFLVALTSLPEQTRQKTAANLLLAYALAFDGGAEKARIVAEQLAAAPDASAWASTRQALLNALTKPAEPAAEPHD